MDESPPTSVVLPTVRASDVPREVADQLDPDDELLIVCDRESDPAYDRRPESAGTVRTIAAGEPEGCSGKCNAVAAGMEAAECDRVVWTDDDFHHPPDWLDRLNADFERRGPTTEVPVFRGRDPLSLLLEPLYLLTGTLSVSVAGVPWGGGVVFDRTALDEDALRRDLRRTVSDDGTLGEHLEFTPADRRREVDVGGSVRAALEDHVRFTKIAYRYAPVGIAASGVLAALATAAALLFPAAVFAASTLFYGGLYAATGVRRWTALLAYPLIVAQTPLLLYALARRTFVWGGRRYRWRSTYDVAVVD